MISIHDVELNGFISEELTDGYPYGTWLGLRCANGTGSSCTWTDGTPYDYHNWYGSQEPIQCNGQECCALMNCYGDGVWCGFDCDDDYFHFICQISIL